MAVQIQRVLDGEVIYPESDGNPIADNTLQFEWIATIKGGLDDLLKDDPQVFVAGDLLWYPVEGDNRTRIAPDALVAFGRPKGHRGSYLQWREGDIAPQVVFEVLSPGNRLGEMNRKFDFYERYGVEEYYVYDPDRRDLAGWLRDRDRLRLIEPIVGWVSPRLGIRFDLTEGGELALYRPDGQRFLSYLELAAMRDREMAQRLLAERERDAAERERDAARLRADRLAARLREAGIDPEI